MNRDEKAAADPQEERAEDAAQAEGALARPKVARVELPKEELAALRGAMAEDLALLGFLHAAELDEQTLDELQEAPFAARLGIALRDQRAIEALDVIDRGLRGELSGGENDLPLIEELAADYAGIYLMHQLQVSPSESPWLDEDHLERQAPMFRVREWYRRYGMAAKDWRKRPDDHIATQLAFAGHLMALEEAPLEEVGRFLDRHMLRWVPEFSEKVARRCATPFYAGLAMLTWRYLEELRDMIEALTGLQRPAPEELEALDRQTDCKLPGEDSEAPFVPGSGGPGW